MKTRDWTLFAATVLAVALIFAISRSLGMTAALILTGALCAAPLYRFATLSLLYGILIISIFVPISFPVGGIQDWGISDFLAPALLVLFLVNRFIRKERITRTPPFSVPLLIFLLVAWAHIPTFEEFPQIVEKLQSLEIPAGRLRVFYDLFVAAIICFLAPFLLNTERHVSTLLKWLGVTFFILIVLSFVKIKTGFDPFSFGPSYATRIHDVAVDGTTVPRMGVMGVSGYFLFVLGLVFVAPRSKPLFVLLAIFCFAAIIQSGGRAVFLASIFAVGLLLLLTGRYLIAVFGVFSVLTLLVVIGMYPDPAHNLPPVLFRHVTIFAPSNPSLRLNADTRAEMWLLAAETIQENPFWGSRKVGSKWHDEEAALNVMGGGTHNAYLSNAASLGLPALMIWLVAAGLYCRRIFLLCREPEESVFLRRFCVFMAVLLGVKLVTLMMEGGLGGSLQFFLLVGLIDVAWALRNKGLAPEAAPEAAQAGLETANA
jgi:hypothetical protein